jgi:hypothetical protein
MRFIVFMKTLQAVSNAFQSAVARCTLTARPSQKNQQLWREKSCA